MSKQVVLIARIRPKADKTAELRDVLKSMLGPTRSEQGCIIYNLHEQVSGSDVVFVFYEVWDSQEDLDRHMQTDHVRGLIDRVEELVDGEIALQHLTLLEAQGSGAGISRMERSARA